MFSTRKRPVLSLCRARVERAVNEIVFQFFIVSKMIF